jgi:DNA integrity scanning protein DisA with diadenylate cyclase activity
MVISYQNYVENIYVHLLKKRWLFYILIVVSFVLYLMPFFTWRYSLNLFIIYALLALLLFLAIAIYLKREIRRIIDQLKKSNSDEFLELLKGLSIEYNSTSDVIHQYIIRNHNFMEIYPQLSKELDTHKMIGTFQDYECVIAKRQIKINVIL